VYSAYHWEPGRPVPGPDVWIDIYTRTVVHAVDENFIDALGLKRALRRKVPGHLKDGWGWVVCVCVRDRDRLGVRVCV
jgi:hypothetical protein